MFFGTFGSIFLLAQFFQTVQGYTALEAGLRAVAADGRPAVVYCHPYEFNPDEIDDYGEIPRRVRMAQGVGRGRFAGRVGSLLTTFAFGRLSDVLVAWGLR